MTSPIEAMQIGRLITLERAAQMLGEKDNGFTDLRWTLRFCIEAFVRLCIRVPHSISTWERESEPNTGDECGKCDDIEDERERLADMDADESDMPQYCDNCHKVVNSKPLMGQGDYIGQRWGVLFVPASEVVALTYPEKDTVRCRVLYDRDDSWSSGYCRLEVASEYQDIQWHLAQAELPDSQELLDKQSRQDYLLLSLADLCVFSEEFDKAMKGEGMEEREALPMNSENKKKTRNRTGGADAKNFIIAGLGEYERKHESKMPPLLLDNLLEFAKTPGKVQGYAIHDDGTYVYLNWDKSKTIEYTVTKAKLSKWFKVLQPDAMDKWEQRNR